MTHVFIIAVEPSADAMGADLIAVLRQRRPDIVISGIGGAAMAGAGVASAMSIDGLSILGFIDGLKAYAEGRIVAKVEEATAAVERARPDAVILIDAWGFMLRVAQRLKERTPDIVRIKYVGPQVWATRPGRAKTLADAVHHLICIHQFEAPFYAPFGLPVTVCGNPAFGRMQQGDRAQFRQRHGVDAAAPLLLVLPGSREGEVRRIGPTFWRVAARLRAGRPALRLAMAMAAPVAELARAQAPEGVILVDEAEKNDAFAAADVALAASGTVTTEAALQGAPVVVGYKMGWVTWALVRLVMLRSRYVTLMNVAAGHEVAPEIIQTRFSVRNLEAACARLLDDEHARRQQIAAQNAALDAMGRGARPAAEIAADGVFEALGRAAQRAEMGV